ncbi:polyprotein [Tanga virus]|uniref:Envelopment polyprotein n=1 Tax=Tanga virus TaxID=2748249 RepID=A0A7D9MVU0_9VIRU|nr:polyprotein [Tanga virus]QLA47024.1 polyprotein [Tanga virus]
MEVSLLILCVLLASKSIESVPFEHCFTGGAEVLRITNKEHGLPQLCLRDDISMLKIETTAIQKGDSKTLFSSVVTRKDIVADWRKCKPEQKELGSIMVLEVDAVGTIHPKMYMCFSDCTIDINKELGQIQFHTESFNFYTVIGSTKASGWFKSDALVSLHNTCENIKISCGQKNVQLHVCFKEHIECQQYLHNTILPGYMANSICHNLEIIIMASFVTLIFCLLLLLMKTYICYILLPIFVPPAYIYGKLYNNMCKTCNMCGLVYHPFSNCGSTCVCGTSYDSTERMKIHRTKGLCPGYKSMRTARYMCKSKTSGLILSICLTVLLLSFITPIGANCTDMVYINDLPEIYKNAIIRNDLEFRINIIQIILTLLSAVLSICTAVIAKYFRQTIGNLYVIKCLDCNMLHEKKRYKKNDEFPSACGSCTCGCPDDPPMNAYHQISSLCIGRYIIRFLRKILIIITAISIITSLGSIHAVAGDDTQATVAPPKCANYGNFEGCTGLELYKSICNSRTTSLSKQELKNKLKSDYKFHDVELKELDSMTFSYHIVLDRIKRARTIHEKLLYEAYYLSHYCRNTNLVDSEISSLIVWTTNVKLRYPNICALYANYKPCKCVFENKDCASIARGLEGTYAFKLGDFNSSVAVRDIPVLMSLTNSLLPGNLEDYILDLCYRKEFDKAINITKDLFKYFSNNLSLKSLFYMIKDLLEVLNTKKDEVSFAPSMQIQSKMAAGIVYPSIILASIIASKEINKCKDPQYMKCFTLRTSKPLPADYLLCNKNAASGDTASVHLWTNDIAKPKDNENSICKGDKLCQQKFNALAETTINLIKDSSVQCRAGEIPPISNPLNVHIKSCRPKKTGFCRIADISYHVCKCESDLIFLQSARGVHDPEKDIGYICFTENCAWQFPIDPKSASECVFQTPRTMTITGHVETTKDFDMYKQSITSKLFGSLINLKFHQTSGLLHFKPSFKSITIQGTETINGIDEAFITTELTAVSGSSVGYHIYTPDNIHLLDIIITVLSSNVSSNYRAEYNTGPTVSYNSVHNEKCTGSCPSPGPEFPKNGLGDWMPFSKEGTSTWGCEEFGCLAIDTGCVYGACKDIIRPESEVYKKISDETNTVTVCITSTHDTYCKTIDSISADISKNFELQYKTVESFKLPDRVLIRNNKLYTGQINGLGEYGRFCGNVQMVNMSVIGTGNPVFDYICHAASRKDIIIKKCYDNNYQSCLNLESNTRLDYLHTDLHTISVNMYDRITGTLKIKAKLGRLDYKQYTEKVELDLKVDCVGCKKCIQSVICKVSVISDLEVSCPVESNCIAYMSRLHLTRGKKIHYLKLNCDTILDENVVLNICKNKINTMIKIEKSKDVLEIAGIGQIAYVKERDERCGTWLCRVSEEGWSFIWEPIKNFFGGYISLFYTILIIIVACIITYYILMPVIFKILDVLKKNEIEYKKENKKK